MTTNYVEFEVETDTQFAYGEMLRDFMEAELMAEINEEVYTEEVEA